MHKQSLLAALDACYASWPQQSWLAIRCPGCAGVNHLEVREGCVSEGYLDGAPGLSFVIKRRVIVDDFHITAGIDSIEIRSISHHWVIPAMAAGN
jgi:hypothetical protein